jgi:hypothetical protein
VKGVGRIGERRRAVAAGLGLVEVRMEDELRALSRRPADRFWIAEPL